MALNNPTNISSLILGTNKNGKAIVQRATSYVGTIENPALSDSGDDIDRWNGYFQETEIPWFGTFATAMYWESHIWDDGLGDASPLVIYNLAKEKGRLSRFAYPGCFVLYGESDEHGNMIDGYSVELFMRWEDPKEYIMVTIAGYVPIGNPMTNRSVQLMLRDAVYPLGVDDPNNIRTWFAVPKAISPREASGNRM